MKVVWTTLMIERLREIILGDENIKYAGAAEMMTAEFGITFTKNACIGKGRRIGLPPRGPVAPKIEGPVTIYELRDGLCKWPLSEELTDKPPYMYCGLPTDDLGCSWCATHKKRVFGKSNDAYSATIYHHG